MSITYARTDYGQGPSRIFLVHNDHWITLREFLRHPIKSVRLFRSPPPY